MEALARLFDLIRTRLDFRSTRNKINRKAKRFFQQKQKKAYPTGPIKVLILCNEKFQNKRLNRDGADRDVLKLTNVLTKLGAHVQVERNLTAQQMVDTIERFKDDPNLSHYGLVAVAIMSHGTKGDRILGTDGNTVEVNTFIRQLNSEDCPSLDGIPKLLFIAACRGSKIPRKHGWLARVCNNISPLKYLKYESWQWNPANKDFLVMYATKRGYLSFRDPNHGTYFIQAVCEIFQRYAGKETIIKMMNKVRERVSHHNFQTPTLAHTLRKEIYFRTSP